MVQLSDEELIDMLGRQLPDLMERRPDLEPVIYSAFLKVLVRKEEVAAVLAELRAFRADVTQRFEQIDQRFGQIDQRFERLERRLDGLETRVDTGFRELHRAIDRLGARWGIRNESLFRETIAAILTQSFGVMVEERHIAGEQFDVLIFDNQHILVEIAASVGPTIQERLERKPRLYIETTGITPTRTILATASIHSRRAQALRQVGIEVIEPEEIE